MNIIPISAQFEIEEGCSHRCTHCYNGNFETVRKSAPTSKDVVMAVAKSGVFNITLTGGEPLLSKDILYYAMEKFIEEQIDFNLNTNLHLLNKNDARIIKDLGTQGVLTSILGSDVETHDTITKRDGAFNKLMKSLDYLCLEDVDFSANMVVTNENKAQVYQTGKMLNDRFNIRSFCATPKIPSLSHPDKSILTRSEYVGVLDSLLNLSEDFGINVESLHPALPCIFEQESDREKYRLFMESRGCSAAKGTLTFSTRGDVRVCSHEQESFGNLLVDELREIYGRMEGWINGEFIPEECDPCAYLNICRGGCRVSAQAITGSLGGLDPYFNGPVAKRLRENVEDVNLKKLKVSAGNVRYRDNGNSTYTLYSDRQSHYTVSEAGFQIFRRYLAGKTFDQIFDEVGRKSELERLSEDLTKSGLLVEAA